MSNAFYSTQERIERLQLTAELWKGTPWRPKSCALGVGVSCDNLPRALYIGGGALSDAFPYLENTPQQATAGNLMEIFLDGRPEFERVQHASAPLIKCLRAGDLLGLFIPMDNVGKRLRQRCVNHLGVHLGQNWFVHTLLKKNTDFDLIHVTPWSQILMAAWRPLERV